MRDLRVFDEFRHFGDRMCGDGPIDREYRGNFLIPRERGVYFVRAARMPDWDHLSLVIIGNVDGAK